MLKYRVYYMTEEGLNHTEFLSLRSVDWFCRYMGNDAVHVEHFI